MRLISTRFYIFDALQKYRRMHVFYFLLWSLWATPILLNQNVTLTVEESKAAAGSTVCVDVSVADFENLLAMQYSLVWDPDILSFVGIQSYNLPGLSEQNFGAHRTEEGVLTFVWLDNTLQGVSLAEGSTIYQLCFQVQGESGQRAAIRFAQQPTPIEAVNLAEELVAFTGEEGGVTVL